MMPLLNQVPDGHLNFSDGGGGRDIQLYLTGDDPPLVERTAHQLIAEMRGVNEIRDPRIRGDLPKPEIVVHPRLDLAAQLGRERAEHQPDDPHRDARRSAAERRQVFAVRPADSDPRELDRKRAARSGHARESAGADRVGRRGAAQDRGGFELRPGSLGRAPLQPAAARVRRGGSESRRRARHGQPEDLCAAHAQAPAAGRASGQEGRHGVLRRDDAEFHAGDRRRRAHGARGAGAAVRAGVPADHHPVGAAAVAGRRGAGAAAHATGRSPSRWSSAC